MRPVLPACTLLLATAQAAAALDCTFPTECMEGEDCMSSGYGLSINETGGTATAAGDGTITVPVVQLVTPSETITPAYRLDTDTATSFAAAQGGQHHLLSVDGEGNARYSVHLPAAGLSILYLGTCTQ